MGTYEREWANAIGLVGLFGKVKTTTSQIASGIL
jgi:hypothetical protein